MNTHILFSLITIGIVATAMSGATYAYFFDSETSGGNMLTADILDLKIRDNDEPLFKDGVTATWTATDMKPGYQDNFIVPFVGLKKAVGSLDANHLEITADYSVAEENPCIESDTDCFTNNHPDEMAKFMQITRCAYLQDSVCIDCLSGKRYNDYDESSGICAGNLLEGPRNDWKIEDQAPLDGRISFYDLKNDVLDNLPPVLGLPFSQFEMGVRFNETAGNDFQGDIFNLTMIFTLNQDASQ